MSNAFLRTSAGNLPPVVPTSFITDSGTIIPDANIVNLKGGSTNIDNDNGIRVIANPNGSNNGFVQLTNRITGSVTTTDATPTILVSDSLGSTPGCYYLQGNITVFNVTDTTGASYSFESAAFTNGTTGTEIGTEEKSVFETAAMTSADFSVSISGNTASITVTGISGKTLHWNGFFTYRFVS